MVEIDGWSLLEAVAAARAGAMGPAAHDHDEDNALDHDYDHARE